MCILWHFMIFVLLQCWSCPVFADSVSNTCKDGEYLHVETGLCTVCLVCETFGFVPWAPCTDSSDTICGPKWTPPAMADEKSDIIKSTEGAVDLTQWSDINHVCVGVLVGLCFATSLVIITAYIVHRRRRRPLAYRIICRNETKSLRQIANERTTAGKENANIYVRTEDLVKFQSKV